MLGLDLFIPESLFGLARGSHGHKSLRPVIRGLGVLFRLGRSAQHGLLRRVVVDHTLRRRADLALCIRDIAVAVPRLEDLDFAGRGSLHGPQSVLACLRVPQHGGFAAPAATPTPTPLPNTIEEPARLLLP